MAEHDPAPTAHPMVTWRGGPGGSPRVLKPRASRALFRLRRNVRDARHRYRLVESGDCAEAVGTLFDGLVRPAEHERHAVPARVGDVADQLGPVVDGYVGDEVGVSHGAHERD